MASMRDIKRRRDSIENTEQITKAMKLVATVKLQKARERAEASQPYTAFMMETMRSILNKSEHIEHPYITSCGNGRKAVLLITSNRGLAGGYNQNVIRKVTGSFDRDEICVMTIGRKGRDYLSQRGYMLLADYSEVINAPLMRDAIEIGDELLKLYGEDEVSELWLACTEFSNTVTHIPKLMRLLPVDSENITEEAGENPAPMNFEPDDDRVLESIIPQYISSVIYGALLEGVASENGARMAAMDAATDNAEELISKLSLDYNRARQSAITQELTEIIAGSQAVS